MELKESSKCIDPGQSTLADPDRTLLPLVIYAHISKGQSITVFSRLLDTVEFMID